MLSPPPENDCYSERRPPSAGTPRRPPEACGHFSLSLSLSVSRLAARWLSRRVTFFILDCLHTRLAPRQGAVPHYTVRDRGVGEGPCEGAPNSRFGSVRSLTRTPAQLCTALSSARYSILRVEYLPPLVPGAGCIGGRGDGRPIEFVETRARWSAHRTRTRRRPGTRRRCSVSDWQHSLRSMQLYELCAPGKRRSSFQQSSQKPNDTGLSIRRNALAMMCVHALRQQRYPAP